MQSEGRVEIINNSTNTATWYSTQNDTTREVGPQFGPYKLCMQDDGNLVAYATNRSSYNDADESNPYLEPAWVWATDTTALGIRPFTLSISDDGVASITDSRGVKVWSTYGWLRNCKDAGAQYLLDYPDTNGDPWQNFLSALKTAPNMNRIWKGPPCRDCAETPYSAGATYLKFYPDAKASGLSAAQHYKDIGRLANRSWTGRTDCSETLHPPAASPSPAPALAPAPAPAFAPPPAVPCSPPPAAAPANNSLSCAELPQQQHQQQVNPNGVAIVVIDPSGGSCGNQANPLRSQAGQAGQGSCGRPNVGVTDEFRQQQSLWLPYLSSPGCMTSSSRLVSPNKKYVAGIWPNGLLGIASMRSASIGPDIWTHTTDDTNGTYGEDQGPPYRLCILDNGSLVLVDGENTILWHTYAVMRGSPPFKAMLGNDAVLKVWDDDGILVWESHSM